ncbi:MAG TPA: protein-disulfide reductase DsbD domain-containing protein [Burkholderiales bacterium]|nr:protein-disulfide reductase DsbD domain-containing protein [Burkholderiales bacterium]
MRLLFLLAICLLDLPARAAPVQQPHSQAELIAERTAAVAGQALSVALRLQLEDGWHVYWKNPGDSGMATSIAWTLPRGFSASEIQWPHPARIDTGPLTNYGYEREVLLLVDLRPPADLAPAGSVSIRAKADWLVCKEICLPASADLALELPAAASAAPVDARWAAAFGEARARLPVTSRDWQVQASQRDGELTVHVVASGGERRLDGLTFFPEREGLIVNAERQRFERTQTGYLLHLTTPVRSIGDTRRLAGVLVAQPDFGTARALELDLPIDFVSPARASARAGLVAALLLAFGGGLLLNLMPCVFPVLAIKVLGVVQQSHGRPARLRSHGLLFALGVLLSFWTIAGLLLALRAQGAALGWGYQLQSPAVVAALALLFFVLALNLSGVFQIGGALQSVAGNVRARGAHADALLTGVLATAVASPCTAPFMGAALGFALVQPAPDAMLVFTALALGMAAPYLLLCFVPQLMRRLPRPGPWMETLKQLLAFPLYATVVWLAWVLGQQVGIDGAARLLAGLVLVGAALWTFGHWAHAARGARTGARAVALALFLAGIAVAWPDPRAGQPAQAAQSAWRPWSEEAVRGALAQGRPAFVDFTAAWCVTCQVNKRLVLSAQAVDRRFAELGIARFRADWTNRDPAITAALARMNRSGVPVYALYSPAGGAPVLLPEVLTRRLVLDALERAVNRPAQASAMITSHR